MKYTKLFVVGMLVIVLLVSSFPTRLNQSNSVSAQGNLAGEINSYISAKVPSSSMKGLGNKFVYWGENGYSVEDAIEKGYPVEIADVSLDPRLAVAIARQESALGTTGQCDGSPVADIHNAWGYGPCIPFETWDEGIESVTKRLIRRVFEDGVQSVSDLDGLWCFSECNDWVGNVSQFMEDMGGDPNNLRFPNNGEGNPGGSGNPGGGDASFTESVKLVDWHTRLVSDGNCWQKFVAFEWDGTTDVWLSSRPYLKYYAIDDVLHINVQHSDGSIASFVRESLTADVEHELFNDYLEEGENILYVYILSTVPPLCGGTDVYLVSESSRWDIPVCEGDTPVGLPGAFWHIQCFVSRPYNYLVGKIYLHSDADISLISPDGVTYSKDSSDVVYSKNEEEVTIIVPDGQSGDWEIVIEALETDVDGSFFSYAIFGFDDLPEGIGGEEPQVVICHHPPGNPDNFHTLTVGASAVPAHVENHGDTLGECEGEAQRGRPESPGNSGQGNNNGNGQGNNNGQGNQGEGNENGSGNGQGGGRPK